ncbi:hypothetical protein TeGR_g10104 [Tetraparma gracilis]|uniref:SET domain-containing protein n=1 Tax=Tetraparma gracilis TaxID=2962635 RepID=A0ABQ6N048_9STRA|nr:hypothetical protein TeGR_g10104 [Tetraparma gracilis]
MDSPPFVTRASPLGGVGNFASRFLAAGELVLLDADFIPLPAPASPDVYESLGMSSAAAEKDRAAPHSAESLASYLSAFAGLPAASRERWLSLSAGPVPAPLSAKIAAVVAADPAAPPRAAAALGAACCNAFAPSALYLSGLSRFNHSCEPCCIYLHEGTGDAPGPISVRALRDVEEGEELTVSYLGLRLYAPRSLRREALRESKFFECGCGRCGKGGGEEELKVPCPSCHPRERRLEPEVEYEETEVEYVRVSEPPSADGVAASCPKSGEAIHATCQPLVVARAVCRQVFSHLACPPPSEEEAAADDEELLALASAVCGPRHSATCLMSLAALDRNLQRVNRSLALGEAPDELDLAEGIDSLGRLGC